MITYYVDEHGVVHFTNPKTKEESICLTKRFMPRKSCKT